MTLPNDPHTVFFDSQDRIYDVAKTMRCLSDEIASFDGYSNPNGLRLICNKIASIGWNSLFSAAIMEDIYGKSARRSEVPSNDQLQQMANQLDGLYNAVNYMEKSIGSLKEQMGQLPGNQVEDFSKMLRDFGGKLSEVANGCR
jgi:hypothetical protein